MNDSSLANLYATVEFLKKELEENIYVIRTLLSWQTERNQSYEEKKVETSYLNSTIKDSSNNTSINNRSSPTNVGRTTDQIMKSYEEVSGWK